MPEGCRSFRNSNFQIRKEFESTLKALLFAAPQDKIVSNSSFCDRENFVAVRSQMHHCSTWYLLILYVFAFFLVPWFIFRLVYLLFILHPIETQVWACERNVGKVKRMQWDRPWNETPKQMLNVTSLSSTCTVVGLPSSSTYRQSWKSSLSPQIFLIWYNLFTTCLRLSWESYHKTVVIGKSVLVLGIQDANDRHEIFGDQCI